MPSTATAGRTSFLPFCCDQAAVRNAMSVGNPLFQAFLPIPVWGSTDSDCIKVGVKIDPCMGSGHILCYMFDVLMEIYEAYGYTARDAVSSIIQNNLYGLDIDDRASQLAYFSVMMKACQYDKRFLRRHLQPHVYAIMESNDLDSHVIDYFTDNRDDLKSSMDTLVSELHDAKEYGSILNITQVDFKSLYERFDEMAASNEITSENYQALEILKPFVQMAETMAQKYQVLITNPPYMGSSGMNPKLKKFVNKHYPDSKSDLFAVFIECCGDMTMKNCYQAMITQHAWMFLSSYEKLRKKILQKTIVNMAHLGPRAFEEIGGEVVQTTSFVLQNANIQNYKATYCRLVDSTNQQDKEKLFFSKTVRYELSQEDFTKIPGNSLAYWASKKAIDAFLTSSLQKKSISPSQNITGNNRIFLKMFWELESKKIRKRSWIFYCKGGGYRKWWGNLENVVNWTPKARHIYQFGDGEHASQIINEKYWYKKGITWGLITSANPSFRVMPTGATFDKGGSTILVDDSIFYFTLAFLNSKVYIYLASMLNPTLNFQVKDVRQMPLIISDVNEVNDLTQKCIKISKSDYYSFETSWNFQKHPLVRNTPTIDDAFNEWKSECDDRFNKLKSNEEELNRIFIDIYGLQDELTPEEDDKDVTVRKADLNRDIKSFISYAVGCMFGRYSLDVDGLAYAGGEWDEKKYKTFIPDEDNIIPITDDDYFEDDMVGRFIEFVKVVYGNDTLEENLRFIADALDNKGSTSREVIRNYFLKDFYKDHCRMYQKRPIYWLFDSGRKNGFKCLIYMHRYQPDTLARIRTDYVHEQQSRYNTAIETIERQIKDAKGSERTSLSKRLNKIKGQSDEIRGYEEKIHHLADQMIGIDLDDGVKHNYALFKDVLAKI